MDKLGRIHETFHAHIKIREKHYVSMTSLNMQRLGPTKQQNWNSTILNFSVIQKSYIIYSAVLLTNNNKRLWGEIKPGGQTNPMMS